MPFSFCAVLFLLHVILLCMRVGVSVLMLFEDVIGILVGRCVLFVHSII